MTSIDSLFSSLFSNATASKTSNSKTTSTPTTTSASDSFEFGNPKTFFNDTNAFLNNLLNQINNTTPTTTVTTKTLYSSKTAETLTLKSYKSSRLQVNRTYTKSGNTYKEIIYITGYDKNGKVIEKYKIYGETVSGSSSTQVKNPKTIKFTNGTSSSLSSLLTNNSVDGITEILNVDATNSNAANLSVGVAKNKTKIEIITDSTAPNGKYLKITILDSTGNATDKVYKIIGTAGNPTSVKFTDQTISVKTLLGIDEPITTQTDAEYFAEIKTALSSVISSAGITATSSANGSLDLTSMLSSAIARAQFEYAGNATNAVKYSRRILLTGLTDAQKTALASFCTKYPMFVIEDNCLVFKPSLDNSSLGTNAGKVINGAGLSWNTINTAPSTSTALTNYKTFMTSANSIITALKAKGVEVSIPPMESIPPTEDWSTLISNNLTALQNTVDAYPEEIVAELIKSKKLTVNIASASSTDLGYTSSTNTIKGANIYDIAKDFAKAVDAIVLKNVEDTTSSSFYTSLMTEMVALFNLPSGVSSTATITEKFTAIYNAIIANNSDLTSTATTTYITSMLKDSTDSAASIAKIFKLMKESGTTGIKDLFANMMAIGASTYDNTNTLNKTLLESFSESIGYVVDLVDAKTEELA